MADDQTKDNNNNDNQHDQQQEQNSNISINQQQNDRNRDYDHGQDTNITNVQQQSQLLPTSSTYHIMNVNMTQQQYDGPSAPFQQQSHGDYGLPMNLIDNQNDQQQYDINNNHNQEPKQQQLQQNPISPATNHNMDPQDEEKEETDTEYGHDEDEDTDKTYNPAIRCNIGLRGFFKFWICPQEDGTVKCNSNDCNGPETLTSIPMNNKDVIVLKTHQNKYVTYSIILCVIDCL